MPEDAGSRNDRLKNGQQKIKDRQYKEEVERGIPLFLLFMCLYSLVCTLYAVCMHPQLHTFLASHPYGHAYSRFCMHCMQSFPELCFRIACIVGFLMHTMHTTSDRPSERRSRWIAYTSAGMCDDRGTRIGRNNGGQPVRRAMEARKSLLSAITGSKKSFMIR